MKGPAEPVRLDPAPIELRIDCAAPTQLPDRALTQLEVEDLWSQDRKHLVECGLTKKALLVYYQDRDARISQSASETRN